MNNLENPPRESSGQSAPLMLRYGCAVAGIALATWVRPILDPLVGDHSRYAIVLVAVLLIATYAGGMPASIALILGALSTDYFLIPPRGEFGLKGSAAYLEIVLYSCAGLGIILICGFWRPHPLGLFESCSKHRERSRGPKNACA